MFWVVIFFGLVIPHERTYRVTSKLKKQAKPRSSLGLDGFPAIIKPGVAPCRETCVVLSVVAINYSSPWFAPPIGTHLG